MTAIAWVLGIGIGLLLLFRFPRQVGILALVLALIGGGLWAYFALQSASVDRENSLVRLTAAVGAAASCPDPEYPILVVIDNGAKRTVSSMSFMLQARRPQHSGTVFNDYRTSDRIIAPGQSYHACWSPDRRGKEAEILTALDWSAEVLTITFR